MSKERGSVTAELVVVFPAVALLVGLMCWLGSTQAKVMTATQASSQLARLAAINPAQVSALAGSLGVGYRMWHAGKLVCVRVVESSKSSWLGSLPIKQKSCARVQGK